MAPTSSNKSVYTNVSMVRESISEVNLSIISPKLISKPLYTYLGSAKPAPISIFHMHNGMKSKLWHLQAQVYVGAMKHKLTTLAPTSFKESVYICVLCSLLRESISEVIFNIFLFKLISVPPGTYFMVPTYITA